MHINRIRRFSFCSIILYSLHSTPKLDIFRLNCNPTPVNRTKVSIFKHTHQVRRTPLLPPAGLESRYSGNEDQNWYSGRSLERVVGMVVYGSGVELTSGTDGSPWGRQSPVGIDGVSSPHPVKLRYVDRVECSTSYGGTFPQYSSLQFVSYGPFSV